MTNNGMNGRLALLAMGLAALLWTNAARAATGRTAVEGTSGKLAVIYDVPVAREKTGGPVVVICHGFTSRKENRLLEEVAASVRGAGLSVVRFDFNGHGESEGDFSKMTVTSELDDLRRILEWVGRQPWGGPTVLVGHSQGGVVSAMTCGAWEGRPAILGAVLLAPAGVLGDNARDGGFFGVKFDADNPPQTIPIFNGTKLVGRGYVLDAQRLPIYETAAKAGARGVRSVCVIHGSADDIVPFAYGKRFADAAATADIPCRAEFHLLNGANHSFAGREGEVAEQSAFYVRKIIGMQEAMPSAADIIRRNREAIRRFESCINTNDLALGEQLISASAAFSTPVSPTPLYGAKGYLSVVTLMRQSFPDIQWKLVDMVADEHTVAVQWLCTGTFTGKAPFAGLQPNGRKFSTTVMNFYSFDADGKIVGDIAATGIAGILQGIGALP